MNVHSSTTLSGERSLSELGPWVLRVAENRLIRETDEIPLEPKVADLLQLLVQRQGQTLSRDDLLETVWPGTFVADDSLYRAISLLRRAFAPYPELAGSIITVARRGYRLAPDLGIILDQTGRSPQPDSSPALMPDKPTRSRTWPMWFLAVTAVALAGASQLRSPEGPSSGNGQMRVFPFTSYPGQERSASFSPDGQQAAFSWQGADQNNWDIYLKRVGEATPRRLTTSASADFGAAWSPRGEVIAFVSLREESCSINTVDMVGSVRVLLPCAAGGDVELSWSADGQLLYFSDRIGKTGALAIHALRVSSGTVSQVTFPGSDTWGDHTPVVSPRGDLLAFARSTAMGVTDIWVRNLSNGTLQQVTDDRLKIHGIAWSPNGRELLYSSNRGGVFALWRKPLAGGEAVPLLVSGLRADSVDVSPSGNQLLFEDERVVTELQRYSLGGGGTPRTLSSASSWDWHAVYSPRGDRVAFVSDRSGSPELWVQGVNDSQPRQVTKFGGPYIQTPAWSPDGTRLIFAAARDGNFDIYEAASTGPARPRRLTSHPSADQNPTWAPDGRQIYFASRRAGPWDIWRLDLDSGRTVQMTTTGGFRGIQDSRGRLIFSGRNGSGLFALDLKKTSAPAQQIVSGVAPLDWANWTVVADAIYFAVRTGDSISVKRMKPDDTIAAVAQLDDIPYFSGLSISPDQRDLLISTTKVIQSDLLLAQGISW